VGAVLGRLAARGAVPGLAQLPQVGEPRVEVAGSPSGTWRNRVCKDEEFDSSGVPGGMVGLARGRQGAVNARLRLFDYNVLVLHAAIGPPNRHRGTREPHATPKRGLVAMQPSKRRNGRDVAALSAALVLSGVMVLAPLLTRAADSPRTVVEITSEKVLAILNSGESEDEKIKRLEQIAYSTIDFSTVSRLVLAKYWKQFTPEQRQQFEDEFKRALTVSYGRRIGQFGQERVVILGERQEQLGDVTVQSHIVGGKAGDIKVDYRLRQKDGIWYVIDVIVEGVSIVSSYRTQFQEIIGQGGPDRLLAELRQKNSSGEGLAPIETTAKDGAATAQ